MRATRSFIMFRRICGAGFKNFGRNAWLTIAATVVMYVALVVVLAGAALNLIMRDTINRYSEQFTVAVYLRDNANTTRVDELRQELQKQPYVAKVTYISKEDALQRFQERYASDPDILEGFNVAGGNSLPASFDIVLKDLQKSSDIEPVALSKGFDKDVVTTVSVGKTSKNKRDAERTVQVVANAKRWVARISIGASLLFGAISVLIIFNTIRMAIFTRAEEIRIMKLIGAAPSYIRGPFLFESSMYGIVAGTLAYATVTAALIAIGRSTALLEQIPIANTIALYKSNWIVIYLAIVGVGAFIGMFSSLLAMEKHLKLKKW